MNSGLRPRRWWSTALVSFFGGPFGGFLWIGAGKWAAISFALFCAAALWFCYFGVPIVPGTDLSAVVNLFGFAISILSVALVVPFAKRFKPVKWYSHGLSVLALVLLSSYFLAFAVRSFLFQPFSMPSGSMEPSLVFGDHFFVSKASYGYSRGSVPFGFLPIEGRIFGAAPQRGDIVVFHSSSDPGSVYVKRVVGLPGEQVQMIDGALYINRIATRLTDAGTYTFFDSGNVAKLQRETLPNGVSYSVIDLVEGSIGDNTRPIVVPDGQYFVLGDNRDNSADSRFSMGTVPYEALVGKAVRLFWNSQGIDYADRQVLIPVRNVVPD